MKIDRVDSGLLHSNMYVVTENGHAIVIDPCRDIRFARGLEVDYLVVTHEHYDHISGVNVWKEATNTPLLCSAVCGERIVSPKKNLAGYFKEFCELQTWVKLDMMPSADRNYFCTADEVFEDEMRFFWQGHEWYFFEIPGHSLGSIGILLDGEYFFSGDSLIQNCEIALGLPGGSKRKWREVGAPRLTNLPNGIRVYPGHFESFLYQKASGG